MKSIDAKRPARQGNFSRKGLTGIWISMEILRLPNLSPSHKMILSLAKEFSKTGLRISNAKLAKLLGLSTRQIVRIIKTLRDDGYLADRGPDKWHRILVVNSDKMSLLPSQTSDRVSPKKPQSRDVGVHHKKRRVIKETSPSAVVVDSPPIEPAKVPSKPRLNAWACWVDTWREERPGRPDPLPVGPNTKAAKELGKLIGNREELVSVYRCFLRDQDQYLLKQGHALRLITSRVDAYRGRSAEVEGRGDPTESEVDEVIAAC